MHPSQYISLLHRSCTTVATGYRNQLSVVNTYQPSLSTHGCGWFGQQCTHYHLRYQTILWRVCSKENKELLYYSLHIRKTSYRIYRSVLYYYETCCSGYGGPDCERKIFWYLQMLCSVAINCSVKYCFTLLCSYMWSRLREWWNLCVSKCLWLPGWMDRRYMWSRYVCGLCFCSI